MDIEKEGKEKNAKHETMCECSLGRVCGGVAHDPQRSRGQCIRVSVLETEASGRVSV